MTKFTYTLVIECDTEDQAMTVISERLGYDEQYDDPATGEPFDYRVGIAELDPTT